MKLNLNKNEVELLKGMFMYASGDLRVGLYKKLSAPKKKRVLKLKRYSFGFEGGGWNTIWAKTKAGAYKAACKQYSGSNLIPAKGTFGVITDKSYSSVLNMTR